MSDARKIYRTHAYVIPKDDGPHTFFWSLDPAFGEEGYWIREHDLYAKGSRSQCITPAMSEKDALAAIEEIERDTAKKHPKADESFKDHRWIGSNYREAATLINHPSREAERKQQVLKDLKARKPAGLTLRP